MPCTYGITSAEINFGIPLFSGSLLWNTLLGGSLGQQRQIFSQTITRLELGNEAKDIANLPIGYDIYILCLAYP